METSASDNNSNMITISSVFFLSFSHSHSHSHSVPTGLAWIVKIMLHIKFLCVTRNFFYSPCLLYRLCCCFASFISHLVFRLRRKKYSIKLWATKRWKITLNEQSKTNEDSSIPHSQTHQPATMVLIKCRCTESVCQ